MAGTISIWVCFIGGIISSNKSDLVYLFKAAIDSSKPI